MIRRSTGARAIAWAAFVLAFTPVHAQFYLPPPPPPDTRPVWRPSAHARRPLDPPLATVLPPVTATPWVRDAFAPTPNVSRPRSAPAPLKYAPPAHPLAWLFTRSSGPKAGTFDLLAPLAKATWWASQTCAHFASGGPAPAWDGVGVAAALETRHRVRRRLAFPLPGSMIQVLHGAPPVVGLPPTELAPHAAHAHHTQVAPIVPPAASPVSLDLIDPIVKRIAEVRDRLVADPAQRTPAELAAFESVLGQLEDHLRGGRITNAWVHAVAVKGRLFLALVDRARAAHHLGIGQAWLDALCPEAEPMVFRNVGGVRVVTRGDASRPEIALTFDGGPGPDTNALLDYLKSENVKGTWFLLGCFVTKDPATAKRIADEGHVIANHTMTHAKWKGLAKISAQYGAWEIEEGARVISAATGATQMDLFRPPYGSGAEIEWVNRIIAKTHRYSIMWTIDSLDSMGAGIEKQIRRVLTSPKLNGAIVLTHDHSKHILTLIKTIVPELKRRGYRFVTVPDLLIAGEYRLRGERFAELCVAVQEGRLGTAYLAAQRSAQLGRQDRLNTEMADLAHLIERLYPAEVAAAKAAAHSVAAVPAARPAVVPAPQPPASLQPPAARPASPYAVLQSATAAAGAAAPAR